MKKLFVYINILTLTLIICCESDKTEISEENLMNDEISLNDDLDCVQIPCVPPNINEYLSIILNFENFDVGNQISIKLFSIDDNDFIETKNFVLDQKKQISIGSDQLGFSLYDEKVLESPVLNYEILVMDELIGRISNILIERTIPPCGCATYKISNFILDDQLIQVDSETFIINL